MNYKEKVAKQIHDALSEIEQTLIKQVTDLVVESFKNGVETGKQAKSRKFKTEKGGGQNAGEEEE